MADERLNPNWGNELKAATNAAGEVVGVLKPQSDSARAPIVVAITDAVTGGIATFGTGNSRAAIGGMRTTPLRVVSFGDSTAVIGNTQFPTNQNVSVNSSTAWQSGTKTFSVPLDKYALDLFYPRAYLVGNGGIAAETTAQMLARDFASPSVTRYAITDMINLAPDVVLLRGGSINDFISASPISVDQCVAQHIQIIRRFLSANIAVIDCGFYGYTGTPASLTKAQVQANIVDCNAQFAAFADANPIMLRFANVAGVVGDGAGGYASNMSSDGTHLSMWGQYQAASVEAAAVASLFGWSDGIRFSGKNVFTNSLYATTAVSTAYGSFTCTGSVSGYVLTVTVAGSSPIVQGQGVSGGSITAGSVIKSQLTGAAGGIGTYLLSKTSTQASTTVTVQSALATGVSFQVAVATRQNAKIETIGNKVFATCEFALGTGTNQCKALIAYDPSSGGTMDINAGDVWGFEADVYIASVTPGYVPDFITPGFTSFVLETVDSVGSGKIQCETLSINNANSNKLPGVFVGHISYAPLVYGDGSANLTNGSSWILNIVTTDAAPNVLKIGIANPRMVKLLAPIVIAQGTAVLVGGTVTITETAAYAGMPVKLTNVLSGGTVGQLSIGTVTAGTSFVINSSSGTDTSTVRWEISQYAG